MTPERLMEIRSSTDRALASESRINEHPGVHRFTTGWPHAVAELLAYVDELTRQLDDARDKAINAGIFTSTDGDFSKYTHALNTETCEGCGYLIVHDYCDKCDTELSTPGATSYKP